MIIGEVGQWISPSEAYQSWDYNPSPWGPVGAVIEYGLAGKIAEQEWKLSTNVMTRIVGSDVAQLLQVRLSVGIRPGLSAVDEPEAQSPPSPWESFLEFPPIRHHPLLRVIHASGSD